MFYIAMESFMVGGKWTWYTLPVRRLGIGTYSFPCIDFICLHLYNFYKTKGMAYCILTRLLNRNFLLYKCNI